MKTREYLERASQNLAKIVGVIGTMADDEIDDRVSKRDAFELAVQTSSILDFLEQQ